MAGFFERPKNVALQLLQPIDKPKDIPAEGLALYITGMSYHARENICSDFIDSYLDHHTIYVNDVLQNSAWCYVTDNKEKHHLINENRAKEIASKQKRILGANSEQVLKMQVCCS